MPCWNPEGQQDPLKNETSTFGAAVGQTGSSTRSELMAWLNVLTMPIRSNYATDSAAMLGKALELIDAVKIHENAHTSSNRSKVKNPFGKPWGVQTDGDLWEQAWAAVIKRGAANQKLRKVKGHATQEDITAGRSTQTDKHGNDRSDENADKGVQSIGGDGLVRLASWAVGRHAEYKRFIARIQKFIAAITIVEKEEREKTAKVEKAVLGYDPNKWIKSNGTIRKEDPTSVQYEKLPLPPPVRGKHKFKHCQCLYEQVHRFLADRRWAYAHPESTAGGITWTEVFILFDTRGGRTTEGQHVKSPAAMERAKKRRSKEQIGNIINTSAMVKPTLDEEIMQFKAICRYILHNDLQEEHRKWFRMEPRMQWRRLALLGIEGHQPAISAFCETTEEEDEGIAKAILMQKVGASRKTTKAHTEVTKQGSSSPSKKGKHCEWSHNQMEEKHRRARRQGRSGARRARRKRRSAEQRTDVHITPPQLHKVRPPTRDKLDATSGGKWV